MDRTDQGVTPRTTPRTTRWAVLAGVLAMTAVGGSTAVSGQLAHAPLAAPQALRYALACALLLVAARAGRQPVRRPRGAEWAWLAGVAGSGLLLFNVALVRGAEHAEPAVFGVAVASVPLVLVLAGRRRPAPRALAAALLVGAGAVLLHGAGRSDAEGLGWALLVLAGEVGFTLLAVPVLARHGAFGVSVHTTWMAAAGFAAAALLGPGPAAVRLRPADLLAVAYLAVAVTAVAFVLWYSCVRRLGAGRAGLLTGVAPPAAAVGGVLLGAPAPGAAGWAGLALVVAGLVVGLTPSAGAPGARSGRGPSAARRWRDRASAARSPAGSAR
ncbi:EamA family transporter [Kineococcus sp. SYSU DK006]|uniref:EamA family transporter n=1 Tax=Kineococcus sp. SYSU DK006 TaxID=3383127 RepID=UPI003D7E3657